MSDGNEARPELTVQLQVTAPGFHLANGAILMDSPDIREAVRIECRAFFERLQKYAIKYRHDDA